ncbi:tetratricopeptide repeat protein [Clostridium thermarum]|uniref:tetratricopeptide repeat protein n=1 Tax=Clostridium thermarum TaxID=1716543 RepID=UPI0013D5BBC6|nr:tetratricopeptide repeat protein [Clostridium thermarum]
MIKKSSLIKLIPAVIVIALAYYYSSAVGLALLVLALLALIYSKRDFYYFIKANAAYNTKDVEKAFSYFEKALKVKGVSSRIKNVYAYYLLRNKNLDRAEELLNTINMDTLDIHEKNQARLTWSLIHWKKNNLPKSLELLELIYNEYKCTPMYESYGYLLILNKDYEKALKVNLEAVDYDSSNNIILDNLGETYYALKEYDKAYDIYTNLIEKSPSFPEPYYHFALILKEKGENDRALELLEKALEFKESYLSELNHSLINSVIESSRS